MKESASSYYPPRAGGQACWRRGWFRLWRVLGLERLGVNDEVSGRQFVLGLLAPGYAYWSAGWPIVGRAMFLGYAALLVVFVVALGYAVSNFAFGLLISLHASSVGFLVNRWSQAASVWLRLAVVGTALFAVTLAVYWPLHDRFNRVFMPLRVEGRVVVVNRLAAPAALRRGDVIAYRIHGSSGAGIVFRDGYGLDPVLAVPGDTVRFQPGVFLVNGVPHPQRGFMPARGELVVPEKHWFVWPRMDIDIRNTQVNMDAMLLGAAVVAEQDYLGRPFRHWFGRRQTLAAP